MFVEFGRLARRRGLFALSTLALLAASVPANAQTAIKWLHLEANPDRLATFEEIAAAYEEAHPDVDIQLQFLENEAFKAKLPTLLQSSEAPSMFYTWGGGVLKAQTQTGAIRELTPAMDADGGAWRNAVSPAAIDGLSVDGKVWAAPVQSGLVSFFYNKALFEQAGVDATTIKTWDDFLAAVKTLKDAGIAPIAGGGGEKWPIHFYWSYLAMRELGKDGFDAAKGGEGFQGEGFVKASQHLADLGALEPFQEGYLGATWPDTQAVFADGRAAIVLGFENTATASNQANSATDGKGLPEDQIGRFAFPLVDGGAGVITDDLGGLNGWVVTTNAPPETEDFIHYLTVENAPLLAEKNSILPGQLNATTEITVNELPNIPAGQPIIPAAPANIVKENDLTYFVWSAGRRPYTEMINRQTTRRYSMHNLTADQLYAVELDRLNQEERRESWLQLDPEIQNHGTELWYTNEQVFVELEAKYLWHRNSLPES